VHSFFDALLKRETGAQLKIPSASYLEIETPVKHSLGRIYAVFAWLIVAIGTLHMIATFRLSAGPSLGKVWFFGSGLAIALVGALNLLHRAYGASCLGVRIVCRTGNILLTLIAIVAGTISGASLVQRVIIWSLFGGVLILSCSPPRHADAQRTIR
jgi:putative Ca2+/H+ antiporter (TMEM165/GDT1 family)